MRGMNISDHKLGNNSILKDIEFVAGKMTIILRDGNSFQISLSKYPKLASANISELQQWEVSAAGKGIYWSEIDEDLSISGLIRDAN